MSFYIYKYIDNNEIVYIGQTINLIERINQHKTDKLENLNDIWFFECNNKTEMDSYEYFLIQKYRPKLNVTFNKDYGINTDNTLFNFQEPTWIKFNEKILIPKTEIVKKPLVVKELNYSVLNTLEESQTSSVEKIEFILSLFEQKIIIFSMLNNNEMDVAKFIKFNNYAGGTIYGDIRNSLKSLIEKDILYNDSGFNTYKLKQDKINLRLPINYLKMVFNTNTKYFLPILNETYQDEKKLFYIPVDLLLNSTSYKAAKDCRTRIINPICETLNAHKIKYSFEIETKGRKHIAYIIQLNKGEL